MPDLTHNPYAGQLTELDLDREPGPQHSKASERSWCVLEALMYSTGAVYLLGLLARIW